LLTTQQLLHRKTFGNQIASTRPLEYRREEWQELNKGRERSVRLIIRAMLGVPSAHQGENDHVMWCFQLLHGSVVVIYLLKGIVTEIGVRVEEQAEVEELIDFLLEEVTTKLKLL
jgi:hypothetical protein